MAENTYRTILFEEFDLSKPNLCEDILAHNDAKHPAGEAEYREMQEKLAVHTFDEFLEKFAPKIYEKYEPSPDGVGVNVTYSADYSDGAVEVDIVHHSYYKMLLELYRSKEKSNKSNAEFNYEELFERLKPKQAVEDVRSLRMRLESAYNKYYACLEKGESTDEAKRNINRYRKQVRDQYMKSQIDLLPIAIADLDKKIDLVQKIQPVIEGEGSNQRALPPAGYQLSFRNDGTLEVEEVVRAELVYSAEVVEEGPVKRLPGEGRKLLSDIIAHDYDKSEHQNAFVRNLVISTYAPKPATWTPNMSLMEKEEMEDLKASYERTFRNAKANFVQTMTETVEKLLGVQAFFDHATTNGELTDGLIVANCSVDRLMRECKDVFAQFMWRVGHDTVSKRIWFAIVPRVSETGDDMDQVIDDSFFEDEEEWGADESPAPSPVSSASVSMNNLRQFLYIMDGARIMTIFSFQTNKENNFLMTPKYVEDKRETLGDLKNKHAVYAYPNFTLTRERHIKLFEDDVTESLAIPGVYIDAAYVAGGLLVGSQQPKYLEQRGLRVHRSLPCVRIDFEKSDIRKKLVTKFNKEADLGVNEELRNAINVDRMGFVFSGDEMGDIQNTYVYIANTLYKSHGSNVYRPIYAVLVEDYVRAAYNRVSDKSATGVNTEFIKGTVAEWKKYSDGTAHKNDVNILLYEDEYIKPETNPETGEKELKIKLRNLEVTLDNIDINVEQN